MLEAVRLLQSPGHDVIVFHLLDPDELEFPFEGPSNFQDMETGEELPLVPGKLRAGYKELLAAHTAELQDRFTAGQVDYAVLDTSKPLDHALFRLLLHREKRSRVSLMPLGFLVPAFLLGLAAVVIPILVHLTRRQRARVVEFPSLMFLDRVPFQAESRRRIHHWLLLLFRALAVALIVAAFSRPFFTGSAVAAGAGMGPREVVVLLDRSYSMGVGDRWERALEAARGVFREMGPLDRASLAVFGRNAAVSVRSTSDRSRLLAALDTMEVSDESTSYGPGLKLAQTILEETELPAMEVVLIGDFQRAGWTGDEGVAFPSGTVVTPVALGNEVPGNRAVARVNLPRQRLDGRDRVTPAARITRVGGEGEDTVEVILELEGRELERQQVVLPANGASGVVFNPFNLSQDLHPRRRPPRQPGRAGAGRRALLRPEPGADHIRSDPR